ncbi:hypothetical protein KSS87_012883 [Heliosperma pusillum]|nr:hypothetical protein KSS87_012883 [Heliosperma pusillum]
MAVHKVTDQTLTFQVRRRAPELIPPSGPTPYEFKELSDIDDQEGLRFQLPGIQFYRNRDHPGSPAPKEQDPSRVIKEALGKALLSYYPFAGRLREKEGRKLVVECTGEGVMFIEADANVTLDEFGESLKPPFPLLEELLYDVPGTTGVLNSPLLLIQLELPHFILGHVRCGLSRSGLDDKGGEVVRALGLKLSFMAREALPVGLKRPHGIEFEIGELMPMRSCGGLSAFVIGKCFSYGPTLQKHWSSL